MVYPFLVRRTRTCSDYVSFLMACKTRTINSSSRDPSITRRLGLVGDKKLHLKAGVFCLTTRIRCTSTGKTNRRVQFLAFFVGYRIRP